jgi:hypothetical protein
MRVRRQPVLQGMRVRRQPVLQGMPHCVCHAVRCMVEAVESVTERYRSSAVGGKSTRVLQQAALERASALRLSAVLRTCGPFNRHGGATVQHVAGRIARLLIRSWMTGTTFLTKSSGALSAAAHSGADHCSDSGHCGVQRSGHSERRCLFVPTVPLSVRQTVRPSAVPRRTDRFGRIESNRRDKTACAQAAHLTVPQESAVPRYSR